MSLSDTAPLVHRNLGEIPCAECRHALIAALMLASAVYPSGAAAQTLQPGFQQGAVFTGLTQPTAVKFASDGRVFVAEKSGIIKIFDTLADTTPTVFADLRTNVHDYWDRGLLGLALAPNFPTTRTSTSCAYAPIRGDRAPMGRGRRDDRSVPQIRREPRPMDASSVAGCHGSRRQAMLRPAPKPSSSRTGASSIPATRSGRSRSGATARSTSPEAMAPASTGWTTGRMVRRSTRAAIHRQVWAALRHRPRLRVVRCAARTSRGSATRPAPTVRSLRLDPLTGQALSTNPLYGGASADDDRLVAYGLRNPFRMTIRPGTNEVWIGDVGWNTWEEINRIVSPTDGTVENFGWPCYEGAARQSGYDGANLSICESLYAGSGFGSVTAPFYTYNHSSKIVTGETCPTGSSSIAGLAFYVTGAYPTQYHGALFFADYSRDCIWAMLPGATGTPDPNQRLTFVAAASNPVQLTIGPGGDLFYVDLDGGRIMRVRSKAPDAVATATPTSGSAPLLVTFSGTGSTDPDGQSLLYAWDLDNDGLFDDGNQSAATYTYQTAGTIHRAAARHRHRWSDGHGERDNHGQQRQSDRYDHRPSADAYVAGGQLIQFSGTGTNPEQGTLASLGDDVDAHHAALPVGLPPAHDSAGSTTALRAGSSLHLTTSTRRISNCD